MSREEETKALVERVDELFRPDGDLAAAFGAAGAAYAFSAEQRDLALAFARGVAAADPRPGDDGGIGAIEAAAGMGKTAAYLSALALNAAMFGEKSLVSTRTRALQRQIESEWPMVATAVARMTERIDGTPKRPTLARRVGRRNFIDRDRVRRLASELGGGENAELVRKLRIVAESRAATFDELRQETDPDFLASLAPLSESDLRLTAASSEAAAENYRAHIQRADDADIIVVNHALALIDARLWGGLVAVPSARRVGIFDEADTLPDQARSMAEETVRPDSLRELLKRADLGEPAESARAALNQLADAATAALENATAAPMREPLPDLAEAAAKSLRQSAKAASESDLRDELADAAFALRECAKAARENNPRRRSAVVIAAPFRERPAFALRAPDPAPILSRLWRAGRADDENREPFLRAVVFTSATLSPFQNASPEYDPGPFLKTVGVFDLPDRPARLIPDASPDRRLEPKQFGKTKTIVLAHRAAPRPFIRNNNGEFQPDPDFIRYAALAVRKARECGGRTLVLASSFAVAAELGREIQRNIPDAIVHSQGESLDGPLNEYRKNQSAVLITPSAWEGVNPLGPPTDDAPRIQNIVIPAVPFPPGDEARVLALGEKIRARGGPDNIARAVVAADIRAAAVRKLRQGIGRGFRAKNDICALWILDPRFPLPEEFCDEIRNELTQRAAARHPGLAKAALPARFFKAGRFAKTAQVLNPDGQFAQIIRPQ